MIATAPSLYSIAPAFVSATVAVAVVKKRRRKRIYLFFLFYLRYYKEVNTRGGQHSTQMQTPHALQAAVSGTLANSVKPLSNQQMKNPAKATAGV